MNKMNLSFALAFLMLFNFSSAADLNVFTATPNSYMANASTFYNFTFNISSITNLSNVTIAFPPAFHLSLASVTYGSENLTNGTTTITGQNLSFLLNQSNYFTSSQVFYIGVSGIYNPSTVSNYTLNTSTYDQDGTNNGKNTTFAIIASQISKMDTSLLSLTQASGNTYAITLTGRDAYGNANNSIGFNISSTNATVTTNTTAGPAVFSLSALSAGTSTLNYYSLANPSVTNQTNVTIVAGAISNLELSQLTPTTDSLRTYVITITGRDRLGNINNSG
ncbi:hypothetical protein HY989_00810, partial [Candidatus Micrarchaeota archaeon]|nr:hypothetical protein [Candidatus Micrarchaeota archaeon]